MADQPFNLMALLQAAQQPGMRGMGTGPIPMQNPTPGFRPPGVMGMQTPGMQPQGNPMAGAAGLGAAMAGMRPGTPWTPTSGGATPGIPTAGGDPTGGSGPAFLGGASPLGAPDPSQQQPGFMDFLTGKMRSLFGPSTT